MPITFETIRNSNEAVAIWLIHLHFDAFLSIPAKDLFFSSTEDVDFPIDNTGDKRFIGRLMKDVPKGKHQRDRGNDTAEFSFLNTGNQTYQDFLAYRDIMKRGKVNIYHCLGFGGGYYEGEIRFVG